MSKCWYWVAFASDTGSHGAVITRADSQGRALYAAAELCAELPAPVTAIALAVPALAGDPPADCVDRKLTDKEAMAAWDRWYPSETGFGVVEIDTVEGTVRVATAQGDDVRLS